MDTAYARALFKILENGATPKDAVKTLYEALKSRGRLGLLPKIGRAFATLNSREKKRNAIFLEVAKPDDAKRALREAGELLKDVGVKSGDVKIRVDENLIGGWRLEGRELLHDASFKSQLLGIYERVSEK
jgi:F0F1-type ATP synthase delta subunit